MKDNTKKFNKIVRANWSDHEQSKLRRESIRMEYVGGWIPMSQRNIGTDSK